MRSSFIAIALLLLLPFVSAFGQTASDPNANCQVIRINEIHTPFRITLSHDPAIKKSITDQKNDPASALSLEGADPKAGGIDPATHLSFSSNSTDDWTITVNLDYLTEKTDPRLVIADFYQDKNQQLFLSEKLLNSGLHFCGIFILHAIPAPHIFTSEEILTQAGKIEEEKFIAHDQAINNLADRIEATGKSASLIGVVCIILIIVFIIFGLNERVFMSNFNKMAIEQNQRVEGTLQYTKMVANANDVQNILERRKMRDEFNEIIKDLKDINNNNTNVLRSYLDSTLQILIQHIRNVNPTGEISAPEIPKVEETTTIIPEEIPSQYSALKSIATKVVEKGKDLLFESKSKALEDRIAELKKPEYRGKLYNIFMENYNKVKDNPKITDSMPEVLTINAINFIVKENKGLWPS